MGKTLKNLATGINDNQLAQTVKDSAQQIWLAGLGAFAKAQEEGGKVFDALVREGESIQSRTRKMTGDKIAVVTGKATGTWDRLEQVFEERVARAMGSLGVPSKQEIDQLSKRVSELTAAVESLTGKKVGKPAAQPVVKPATKSAAKPAAKPVAKPAAKSTAKPVAKAVAKPVVKAVAKPAAGKSVKPAVAKVSPPASKAATKAVAKPVAKAVKKPATVLPVTPADVLKSIASPGA